MDLQLALSNFLSPPILFFFLGMLASLVKSDLEIPKPIPKILSLYLLMAIGFKGGIELNKAGFNDQLLYVVLCGIVMASVVPIYSFFILRRKLSTANAAAIAAAYGSVSAVTFITATNFLQTTGVNYSGYLVAVMALMESPAIIVGVLLYRLFNQEEKTLNWSHLFNDAFLNGSVFLLIGSLAIGILSGEAGKAQLAPFTHDLFRGLLTFFLLDMGIVAAKRLRDLKQAGIFLTSFALLLPCLNGAMGMLLGHWIGLSQGDALLFVILCASASYIAVPAAVRLAIPEANPSLYLPMALAVTFPFNIIIAMPIYMQLINYYWS